MSLDRERRRAALGSRALSALYGPLRAGLEIVRTRPFLIRLLFGARLPAGSRTTFDTTTLMLRRALRRWGRDAGRALELGTGTGALLSIYLARALGTRVDGVDLSPQRVAASRVVVGHNDLEICIWESDLCSQVTGRYDLIFMNPPYVPTAVGRSLDLTRRANFDGDQVWDGGDDGTRTVCALLRQAPDHLTESGLLLIGAQRIYISHRRMAEQVAASPCELVAIETALFNPSSVWVLRSRRTL